MEWNLLAWLSFSSSGNEVRFVDEEKTDAVDETLIFKLQGKSWNVSTFWKKLLWCDKQVAKTSLGHMLHRRS